MKIREFFVQNWNPFSDDKCGSVSKVSSNRKYAQRSKRDCTGQLKSSAKSRWIRKAFTHFIMLLIVFVDRKTPKTEPQGTLNAVSWS